MIRPANRHMVFNLKSLSTAFALAIILALWSLSSALAQTIPPVPSGTISQTPETVRPEAPSPTAPQPPALPSEEAPKSSLPSGQTLFVRTISIADSSGLVPQNLLDPVLEPFLGRELTLEEIEAAAAAVTSVYHKQGFILAQAYLPQQNASSGDLTIAVVVGRYGEVTIKNESRLRNGVVSSAFSKMGPAGAPVKNDDVEKVTLALSQLPGGVRPKLTVSAGKEFGTTDFLAEVGYGKLVDGYALVDNQGSKYTGRWRLGAGINFNSPLGLGDRLSFNGMVSQEGSGLLSGRLAYSIPLGVYGPTFTVAVSRTTYELGKQYADLDPVGRSDSLYLGLAYPILRSRNHNLYLSASTTFKDIRDELRVDNLAWNKSATVGALGIGYDGWFHAFGGRDLFLSAEVFLALGRLKAPDQADYQAAGTFSRANATLSASLRLTNTLSALLTLQGQKILNGQRLDGSEQIIISGPSGVRAYLEPVSGDNGWTAELELRCNLPSIGRLNHSLGVFAATGRAWNRNPLSDLDYGVKLSNVGLGYRANFEPFFVSVHVASAVGHWPENYQKEDRTQVVGQFGLLF